MTHLIQESACLAMKEPPGGELIVSKQRVDVLEELGLTSLAPVDRAERGQVLGRSGQTASGVYFIVEGRLQLRRRALDGSWYTAYLFFPGFLFGLASLTPEMTFFGQAEVLTDPFLFRLVPAGDFRQAIGENRHLCTWVVGWLASWTRLAASRLDILATGPGELRVHGLLTIFHHWYRTAALPYISHTEIAALTSLSRESVTRILAKLEEDGVIGRHERRITLLRPLTLPDL